MLKWPAGCSGHQQNAGFAPRICHFKSLILSSLQSSLSSAAGREGALCLLSGDVAGFGKTQCVISQTLPRPLLAHQPGLSFICLLYSSYLLPSFPELKRAWGRGGDVGNHCSCSALSWVAAVVWCLPKGRQHQALARSVLTKVWHTSDAEQRPNSCCPLGMLRTLSRGPGWLSG